jgi:hypothetical protein
VHENTVRNWEARGILRAVHLPGSGLRRFAIRDVERLRAEMFEQLAPATEGPIVNPGRKRRGRLVFGDATEYRSSDRPGAPIAWPADAALRNARPDTAIRIREGSRRIVQPTGPSGNGRTSCSTTKPRRS